MTNPLTGLRSEIDELDRQNLVLLAARFEVVSRVAAVKDAAGLPARIGERIIEVIGSREEGGLALGMPSGAAAAIWSTVVEQSCRHEERLMRAGPGERQLST